LSATACRICGAAELTLAYEGSTASPTGEQVAPTRHHLRVVLDARHQRRVDHDSHRRVRPKSLEAVPSATHRNPQLLPHRVLHGLLAGADDAHVVGLASESLAGPANEVAISRVIRSDGRRTSR
jgi:hypothetical protein